MGDERQQNDREAWCDLFLVYALLREMEETVKDRMVWCDLFLVLCSIWGDAGDSER